MPQFSAFTGLRAALAVLPLLSLAPRVQAAALPPAASGLAVSVDEASGAYKIAAQSLAWTFTGSVGAPLSAVKTTSGRDKIGAYQELAFQWGTNQPYQGTIRRYAASPALLFSLKTLKAATRMTTDFPNFTTFPQRLHPMSYGDSVFSPHKFRLVQTATPWVLFDDQAHTALLSPASDFIVSQMHGDAQTSLASGLNPELTGIPAGFTHSTLLVIGDGIGRTMQTWGRTMTAMTGKTRPTQDADLMLKYLGYWTDNGAHYYYNYDKTLGYAGTMLALRKQYQQENIPIHYLQLDSWWYQKTRTSPAGKVEGPKNANLPEGTWNAYGGTLDYTASPDLFPSGLGAFQKQLGLPLVVHGRWIDPTSPYHKDYKISGVAPVDPRWWGDRTAYLKENDVICYEQDWLSEIYPNSPEMARTLGVGTAFADNMAEATRQNEQAMQYCMATPRFFLQGAKYSNLTTIRTSEDRFERGKWNNFIYTSQLAYALGAWPWTDVFMSTETDNLLLATLSAGPVGNGDALGNESRDNLLRAVRADGVIVKPDVPLIPTDASIVADAAQAHTPLVAATYTDRGVGRTAYVFAFIRKGDSPAVSFSPAALGVSGPVYVYNGFNKTAKKLGAGETYSDTLGTAGRAFYEIAPITPSGIALLGDGGKFVSTGRQRLPTEQNTPGGLKATVVFAAGETDLTLHGFAAALPRAAVTGGTAGTVQFDPATGHFSVTVSPAAGAPVSHISGDPTRQVTVLLRK